MKYLFAILAAVVALGAVLFVVFKFVVSPSSSGATIQKGAAPLPASAPPSAPKTDPTAQRLGAIGELVGALGGSVASGIGAYNWGVLK